MKLEFTRSEYKRLIESAQACDMPAARFVHDLVVATLGEGSLQENKKELTNGTRTTRAN